MAGLSWGLQRVRGTLGPLGSQVGPLVAGRLASTALTFCVPLLLARLLDPAGFGAYKQLFLVAQTALLAGQLGLNHSLFYFLPREGRGRGAFVAQAVICLAAVGAVAGLALSRIAPRVPALTDLGVPLGLIGAALLVAAPLEASLTSEGRVALSAAVTVLSDGTRALFLLAGATRDGVRGIAWAAAAWAGLRVAGLAVALLARAIPFARPRREALRRQLAYALPFAGAAWLWVAQKQFAQFAVATTVGAASYARFAVASFHVPLVDILVAPMSEVLMVRLGRASHDRAARAREWGDAVEKLASMLWPAAACAWLLGPSLVPLAFGASYTASVPLFLVATAEVPLAAFPVDGALRAAGATRFLFGWAAVRLALVAAAVLAGMRLAGLHGALAGPILVEALSRFVLYRRARTWLGPHALPSLALLRIALASLLATLPAWPLRRAPVAAGLVYAAAYVVLLLAFRRGYFREASTDRPTSPAA